MQSVDGRRGPAAPSPPPRRGAYRNGFAMPSAARRAGCSPVFEGEGRDPSISALAATRRAPASIGFAQRRATVLVMPFSRVFDVASGDEGARTGRRLVGAARLCRRPASRRSTKSPKRPRRESRSMSDQLQSDFGYALPRGGDFNGAQRAAMKRLTCTGGDGPALSVAEASAPVTIGSSAANP